MTTILRNECCSIPEILNMWKGMHTNGGSLTNCDFSLTKCNFLFCSKTSPSFLNVSCFNSDLSTGMIKWVRKRKNNIHSWITFCFSPCLSINLYFHQWSLPQITEWMLNHQDSLIPWLICFPHIPCLHFQVVWRDVHYLWCCQTDLYFFYVWNFAIFTFNN